MDVEVSRSRCYSAVHNNVECIFDRLVRNKRTPLSDGLCSDKKYLSVVLLTRPRENGFATVLANVNVSCTWKLLANDLAHRFIYL